MDSYDKFVLDLKQHLDVDLTGYKRPQMERRINALMRSLNIKNYNDFIQTMKKDKYYLDRFLDHLTINVSEFFRNDSQWQVFIKQILPVLLSETPNLKIWSAGCSSGEEPYTLAMILSEYAPNGVHSITATDFDDRVLTKAREGFYTGKSLLGVPKKYLNKYFKAHEDGYQVKDALKKMITFKHHNLLRDRFPDYLDLIVCRNVVIYFTEETKYVLYKKLYNSLKPKGVLFTGSTEQVIQARELGFESMAIFFYRRT
jgi:chemotaxis protein methyltransferase CheR